MKSENKIFNKTFASSVGLEKLHNSIEARISDQIFLEGNKWQFLKEYGNCWIAVSNLCEIAHGNFQTMLDQLKTSKADFGDVFIKYICEDNESSIAP